MKKYSINNVYTFHFYVHGGILKFEKGQIWNIEIWWGGKFEIFYGEKG